MEIERSGAGDCDDSDSLRYPSSVELCDGVDNDCDAATDEGYDADGDGIGTCDDCDDADAAVFPGAEEVCDDSVDDDCDGYAPACRSEGDIAASEAGILLFGASDDDAAGSQVGTGDVDGDGQADLFVAAPGASYAGSGAGSVYVVRGPLTADFTLDTSIALRFDGYAPSDNLGRAMAGGDIDGDGSADLGAGAASDDEGGSSSGAVYVISLDGAVSGSAASAGHKLVGETAGDLFGTAVAVGDFDGDGQEDVLVGGTYADGGGSASGAVWLFTGPVAAGMDASLADATFEGEDASDYAGTSLGSGDLTGDGLDDVIVGASGDDDGGSASGAIYILSEAWGTADLSIADAKVTGAAASDALGASTPLVLDLDGDGWGDLVAAARSADGDASDAGAVYGWHGPILEDTSASVADMTLLGQGSNDYAGTTLASAGDLDGDGRVELLVGAYNNDTAGAAAGCLYLLYGPPSAAMSLVDAEVTFLGESIGDLLGFSAAANADLDGDGAADIVIGAASSDLVASDAGAVYLFSGE